MIRILFIIAALCASIRVSASVPGAAWHVNRWDGPGVFCGSGYTFELKKGEMATAAIPDGAEDTIIFGSHGGRFAITSYFGRAPVVEKSLVYKSDYKKIFFINKVIKELSVGVSKSKSYLIENKKGDVFILDFYVAVDGVGGWGEFPDKEVDAVLKRILLVDQPGRDHNLCLKPI